MPAIEPGVIKELYHRLDETMQLGSREDLYACARMLVLELAYLKVRYTVNIEEIPAELQALSPAQRHKILQEANLAFAQIVAQVQARDENIVPMKSKSQP